MFQQLMLIGNLGGDAEVRAVNDKQVISFRLATSESWKDKNGQKQTRTEWHQCSYFVSDSKIAQYLKKGNLLTVLGKIRTREYEDKNGQKQTVKEVIVDELKLMPNNDKSGEKSDGQNSSNNGGSSGRGGSSQRSNTSKGSSARAAQADAGGDDDQIPF